MEIKILRRVRAESSRRPPRHRRLLDGVAMPVPHRSTEPGAVIACFKVDSTQVLTAFAIDIDKYLGPLACFDITYYDELLFWTLLPPAALVVALVVAVGTVAARRASRELPDALRRVVRAWIIACITCTRSSAA